MAGETPAPQALLRNGGLTEVMAARLNSSQMASLKAGSPRPAAAETIRHCRPVAS